MPHAKTGEAQLGVTLRHDMGTQPRPGGVKAKVFHICNYIISDRLPEQNLSLYTRQDLGNLGLVLA